MFEHWRHPGLSIDIKPFPMRGSCEVQSYIKPPVLVSQEYKATIDQEFQDNIAAFDASERGSDEFNSLRLRHMKLTFFREFMNAISLPDEQAIMQIGSIANIIFFPGRNKYNCNLESDYPEEHLEDWITDTAATLSSEEPGAFHNIRKRKVERITPQLLLQVNKPDERPISLLNMRYGILAIQQPIFSAVDGEGNIRSDIAIVDCAKITSGNGKFIVK